MSNKFSQWSLLLLAMLAGAGFFMPFWPFAALAAALAGALWRPVLGLCLGIFFDILWGTPGGWLGVVQFPLTLLAILSFGARLLADRYFFHHVPLKTLY